MSDIVSIRASSFARLLECPHSWEGTYLLGMRGRPTARAHLGTSLHASTATFDKGRMQQSGVTVDDAAGVFVDKLTHPDEPIDWSDGDMPLKRAEEIGLSLNTAYCTTWSPRWTFREVEMTIPPLDVNVGGIVVRLTGTLDRTRVVENSDGDVGIVDVKSGKTAVSPDGIAKTKGHAPQVGLYELIYENATNRVITAPAGIVGLQTILKARVGYGVIENAREQIVGTRSEPGLLEMAAVYLKAGRFPPNPRAMICGPKYCARYSTCKFHD